MMRKNKYLVPMDDDIQHFLVALIILSLHHSAGRRIILM